MAMVAGLGVASWWLSRGTSGGLDEWLPHLAFNIPGFVLAAYLANQSAQHRKVARWASILKVQLGTIRRFVAPMTPEQQNDLLAYFGRRVMGDLPSDGTANDEGLTTALSVIERLTERLGSRS